MWVFMDIWRVLIWLVFYMILCHFPFLFLFFYYKQRFFLLYCNVSCKMQVSSKKLSSHYIFIIIITKLENLQHIFQMPFHFPCLNQNIHFLIYNIYIILIFTCFISEYLLFWFLKSIFQLLLFFFHFRKEHHYFHR